MILKIIFDLLVSLKPGETLLCLHLNDMTLSLITQYSPRKTVNKKVVTNL